MVLIGVSALRLSAGSIDVVSNDKPFGTFNDTQSAYIEVTDLPTNSGAFGGGSAGLFEADYSSNVYSINSETGQATLVGGTDIAPSNGLRDTSLSFEGMSLLDTGGFGQNDELYLVNAVTGIATDLGSTGVTGIAGSAFADGTLELYRYSQPVNHALAAPDPSVKFTRLVQPGALLIGAGAADFRADDTSDSISRVNPLTARTPEPATQALIGAGLTALGMLRWGRRRTGQKSR